MGGGEYLGRYPSGQVHPPGQVQLPAMHAGIRSISGRYPSYWNAFSLKDFPWHKVCPRVKTTNIDSVSAVFFPIGHNGLVAVSTSCIISLFTVTSKHLTDFFFAFLKEIASVGMGVSNHEILDPILNAVVISVRLGDVQFKRL